MENVLDTNLTGKVAVVTGAGGVLCSEFSRILARAGAKVALLDLNDAAAEEVAASIREEGLSAKAYKCNVLDKAVCLAVAEQVKADFGPATSSSTARAATIRAPRPITKPISPATSTRTPRAFSTWTRTAYRFVFNLNFLGTLLPTQAFAAQMVGRSGCSILNISSMNAFTPLTKIPAYSGAKAAISNFTQWLAVHFAPAGIRVNAIAPGFFVTKQNQKLLFNDDGTPTPRTGKILAATPMGRFGEASELSGAVLFLLNNDAASFITGVVLPIDGGFSAYSGV